jgi:hypothetical protein
MRSTAAGPRHGRAPRVRDRGAESSEEQGRFYLALLIAVLLLPALLGSSKTIFNDGDVSWHIATGQWILDHRAIPHGDPFSFTWAGKPWVPIEWLAEVMLAAAYRIAAYSGVAGIVTAALIALHSAVFFNAVRHVRPFVALGAVVAMDVVVIPMMLARPHLLTWPLLALWVWLMLRARERDRAPPLAAALLIALWANLHGSFVFGLGIAGAFALETLVSSGDRGRALRQWAIFGVACLAAVLLNGNGVEGVVHPLRFTQLQMLPLIDEWKPSSVSITPLYFAVLALTLAVILWRRPRLHWVRWLLLAGLLALALLQVRHQAMLAIVAAMIIPTGFAATAQTRWSSDRRVAAVTAIGAALLILARSLMPLSPPENEANPWHLIAAVPAPLRAQPVLNSYAMGGPLILSGIRPYIDGRGDMYGDAMVLGYKSIADGNAAALGEAVRRWDIRWAIVSKRSRHLVALLDRTPGWRRIASDDVGMIYVRDGAPG